ncbi:hypothetical protein [Niabella aquatica]
MRKNIVALSFLYIGSLCQAQSNIFESNGDIGIGTMPTQKLTVSGNINILNPTGGHYLGFGNIGNNEYNTIGSMYSAAGLALAHGLKPSNSTNKMVYSYPAMSRSAIIMGSGFIEGGIKFYTKSYSGEAVGAEFSESPRMIIADNGNVGIGVSDPTTKLETAGALTINPGLSDYNYLLFRNNGTSIGIIGSNKSIYGNNESNFGLYVYGNNSMEFSTNNSKRLIIDGSGGVAIGTTSVPIGYKLAVSGKVIADEIKIKPNASGWPDYVFKPGYIVRSLEETEKFIKHYQHLPEIPSAEQVAKDGVELGNGQAILIKKIEEMTLYLININKRVKQLETENKELKRQLKRKQYDKHR